MGTEEFFAGFKKFVTLFKRSNYKQDYLVVSPETETCAAYKALQKCKVYKPRPPPAAEPAAQPIQHI